MATLDKKTIQRLAALHTLFVMEEGRHGTGAPAKDPFLRGQGK